MKIHQLQTGRIHEGDWMEADLAPGYTLAIIDGPYAMGMAAWDKMKLDDLAEWYRPHLARVSELLAPSASVYLWNTAAGWARIDPVMRGLGWELVGIIIWYKTGANPALISASHASKWPDVTEICGHYRRGNPYHLNMGASNVWSLSPVNDLGPERLATGEKTVATRDLASGYREFLHNCQKPLAFTERMIRASTRPGDRILSPFGGTCREAVICEWIARTTPEDARGFDCCELNQDGKDYIGPVLRQIAGEDTRPGRKEQVSLFPTPR